MKEKLKAEIKELIEAARPFLSGDVVDELCATIPLMERLEKAIKAVEAQEGSEDK